MYVHLTNKFSLKAKYINLKNDMGKHDKKLHPSSEQFQTFSMTHTFSHGPDGCMPQGATGVPLDTYIEIL